MRFCTEIPHGIEIDLAFGHSSTRLRQHPLFFVGPDAADMLRSGSVRRFSTDGLRRRPTIKDNSLVQHAASRAFFSGTGIFLGEISRPRPGAGINRGKRVELFTYSSVHV
jgi:hypothetical protein